MNFYPIKSNIYLALFILLGQFQLSAFGTELTQRQQALKDIEDFAKNICTSIPLTTSETNSGLDGQVKAELNGVVNKLVGLGITGAGSYKNKESQNVLQSDLAETVKHGDDCRLQIANKLIDKFFPQPESPKPQINSFLQLVSPKPQINSFFQPESPKPQTNSFFQPDSPKPQTNSFLQPESPKLQTNSFLQLVSPKPQTNSFFQPESPKPQTKISDLSHFWVELENKKYTVQIAFYERKNNKAYLIDDALKKLGFQTEITPDTRTPEKDVGVPKGTFSAATEVVVVHDKGVEQKGYLVAKTIESTLAKGSVRIVVLPPASDESSKWIIVFLPKEK